MVYECLGQTLAHKVGADPRYNHQNKDELIIFQPWPRASRVSYANVDTTGKEGLDRAAKLGLVDSRQVDIIFTRDVQYAAENLYGTTTKGRLIALFRHPVDRLVRCARPLL